MAKKNVTRSKSRPAKSRTESRSNRRASGFDSRRTLGPVATLLLRSLVVRDRSLKELSDVHPRARRALRSLLDRGLVVERTIADNELRFSLSTSARRSFSTALRTKTVAGTALVVTGVAVRDQRRSKRSLTFKR